MTIDVKRNDQELILELKIEKMQSIMLLVLQIRIVLFFYSDFIKL